MAKKRLTQTCMDMHIPPQQTCIDLHKRAHLRTYRQTCFCCFFSVYLSLSFFFFFFLIGLSAERTAPALHYTGRESEREAEGEGEASSIDRLTHRRLQLYL